MTFLHRFLALFRRAKLDREMDAEMRAHLVREAEANVARGMSPEEARRAARRAFGGIDRIQETERDSRGFPWIEDLVRDVRYSFRQLKKRKTTSAAAILSLALGIGASTTAFRLIDALLLRPLPVANANRLYSVTRQGIFFDGTPYSGSNSWAYPAFLRMRNAVSAQAELMAVADAKQMDLTYGSNQEMEEGQVQYVSGRMFDLFGLRPALGRLLTKADNLEPGAHPLAVLSHDYWVRRFGRDPQVIGRTFRIGETLFEIVGVGPESFTGTDPGTYTDIFVPTMMHPLVTRSDATWFRILVEPKPGVGLEAVRARLDAASHAFEVERSKEWSMEPIKIERWLGQTVRLASARTGASDLQQKYRSALIVLGVLVALVLLIACANVANLLTAQATTRAREMALRVSLGAGRRRLVQLVMVESALLALLAAMAGVWATEWAAPFIVHTINPPDNPARLALPLDFRVLGFSVVLTAMVAVLFGLMPALRASLVQPVGALKGGAGNPSRRRLMHVLIAAQVAFCFLIVMGAGLFVGSFDRLSHRPTGFSPDRVLTLDTIAQSNQPATTWIQLAENMRSLPGVDSVALAGWPLLSGRSWNGTVSINGTSTESFTYFLNVSPGWLETMRISLVGGRDFRASDAPRKVALVNHEFAKRFFSGESPVGKRFSNGGVEYEVVGLVDDVPYRDPRDVIPPQAYFPFASVSAERMRHTTVVVRSSLASPETLAAMLRRHVTQERPDLRVDGIRTQSEIIESHTVRERLLARLATFFGLVALLLAGVGVYGVLEYSVLQRRREIGIRLALGAQPREVLGVVVRQGMLVVGIGGVVGLAAALLLTRTLSTLLFDIEPTDPTTTVSVAALIATVALLACWMPARHAAKVDPTIALRAE